MADLSKNTRLFLQEWDRMCCEYTHCVQCEMNSFCDGNGILSDEEEYKVDELIEKVQRFHDTHPQKTYAQDFFKKFPNCCVNDVKIGDYEGVYPHGCRGKIYGNKRLCINHDPVVCGECWNEPMEDE